MIDLLNEILQAHGGLDRWNKVRSVTAIAAISGPAFALRGQEAMTREPVKITVDAKEQRTVFAPFLGQGKVGVYEPLLTSVQSQYGVMIEKLENPRDSFAVLNAGDPWSATQLMYFAGYAMWTYFTLPFSLTRDGVLCTELEPHIEGGESWRRLKVLFPPHFTTHSNEQVLFIDGKGHIRRQDYSLDIGGGAKAAHYVDGHESFADLIFPTRRRIYRKDENGIPLKDFAIIAADLSDFALEYVGEPK